MNSATLGFIVRGGPEQPRKLCEWHAAFRACAECHEAAPVGTEAYLSMFTYPHEMTGHYEAHGGPKGYTGATGGPFVWLDLDGPGALDDTRRLCAHLGGLGDDLGVLVFYSGGKGYHVGIPTAAMAATPGAHFNATARVFAESLARDCGAAGTLDAGIYDRVRIFRAPNSRHPKSGLHKVALDFESVIAISEARVLELARQPYPFELPEGIGRNDTLAARWINATTEAAGKETRRTEYRQAAASGDARLNPSTLAYLRDGGANYERAVRLFQAAANLAECGAPERLVWALLEETALDSGLPPLEVRRQISCGLAHVGRGNE